MRVDPLNYLAHGFRHLRDPWFTAGTALPDWLRVLDRRARLHEEDLARGFADADRRIASLAAGAARHHADDRRFHSCEAFATTKRAIADVLRPRLPESEGHRPSFVAHLVLEVELDASLAEERPGLVDAYYSALASLDPDDVERTVRRLLPSTPTGVAALVRRFVAERFVADYADADLVVRRLDRVVRRVRQPALPASLRDVLPAARKLVEARRAELLGE